MSLRQAEGYETSALLGSEMEKQNFPFRSLYVGNKKVAGWSGDGKEMVHKELECAASNQFAGDGSLRSNMNLPSGAIVEMADL